MKYYFILFAFAISCKQQTNNKKIKHTTIKYELETYNLGSLKQKDSITFYVKYKNIGKYPLVINFAKGSCGCTAIGFNKEPLDVNKFDSLKILFRTPIENGKLTKTVIVSANTNPSLTQVFFTANVITKN